MTRRGDGFGWLAVVVLCGAVVVALDRRGACPDNELAVLSWSGWRCEAPILLAPDPRSALPWLREGQRFE